MLIKYYNNYLNVEGDPQTAFSKKEIDLENGNDLEYFLCECFLHHFDKATIFKIFNWQNNENGFTIGHHIAALNTIVLIEVYLEFLSQFTEEKEIFEIAEILKIKTNRINRTIGAVIFDVDYNSKFLYKNEKIGDYLGKCYLQFLIHLVNHSAVEQVVSILKSRGRNGTTIAHSYLISSPPVLSVYLDLLQSIIQHGKISDVVDILKTEDNRNITADQALKKRGNIKYFLFRKEFFGLTKEEQKTLSIILRKKNYFLTHTPSCLNPFKASFVNHASIGLQEYLGYPDILLSVSCVCGSENHYIQGFVEDSGLQCPIHLKCKQCGKVSLLFDDEIHGYNAMVGPAEFGEDPESLDLKEAEYQCPSCNEKNFQVYVKFTYSGYEDLKGQKRKIDFFDGFALLGVCQNCLTLTHVTDYECA